MGELRDPQEMMAGRPGLPGEQGPAGRDGSSGPAGAPGQIGMPGSDGLAGFPGQDGDAGRNGRRGSPGANGDAGDRGEPGKDGAKGSAGLDGADGEKGQVGEQGYQGSRGPRGAAGTPGKQGPRGDAGEDGAPGSAGPTGKTGAPGRDGAPGPKGTKGPSGNRGSAGEEGEVGEVGQKGQRGLPGIYGPTGKPGSKGNQGPQGPVGTDGPQGVRGDPGPDGVPGKAGAKGIQGPPGRKGNRGIAGPTGNPGKSGAAGNPGVPGPAGRPGEISGLSEAFENFFSLVTKGPIARQGYHQRYRYYKAANEEQMSEINRHHNSFKKFDSILQDVDNQDKHIGTMLYPARTCKELFDQHKDKKTGSYFVDPNEGSANDAVLVHCDKETKETCISPNTDFQVEKKNWGNFNDQYKWILGDLQDGKIEYSMSTPQMKLLQMLSYNVRQNFTYHCKDSFAFKDSNGKEYASPLKIKVDNEHVEKLSVNSESREFVYDVIQDECANAKHGIWRKTVLEIKSKISEELPILDVATHDIGDFNEEFGLEVGAVCFS